MSLLGGVLIAGTLVWLMQQMLSSDEGGIQAASERPVMEFVRLKRSSETRVRERKKLQQEPPPEEKIPPRPPRIELATSQPKISVPAMAFNMPQLPLALNGPYLGPVREGPPDRDFIPVSRVPPQYPYRAERKGVEGWVKVSFLITEQGSVEDVVLVDAKPKEIFNHAALKAVKRWKFKPRIVDGKAVAVRAEQIVNFRLGKGAK